LVPPSQAESVPLEEPTSTVFLQPLACCLSQLTGSEIFRELACPLGGFHREIEEPPEIWHGFRFVKGALKVQAGVSYLSWVTWKKVAYLLSLTGHHL
jgi:hypothetical protein